MIRIGVDTGGTFTDLVILENDQLQVHKVRSTPTDPAEAIVTGLVEAVGTIPVADIVHGSTVATNAVLERRGARVALIVTAGFEDVLRIGRQTRRALYDFLVEDRAPLVDVRLVFGVQERIAADGSILTPLQRDQRAALLEFLKGRDVDAVAVCLLHSYVNPAHELEIARWLTDIGMSVSCSHGVLPEYREFERWSTTVVNAYVKPLMVTYLSHLETWLKGSRLGIMQSTGGSVSAQAARDVPVRTIVSGPAAGVVGARAIADMAGYLRAISFDMGGTSTDVSLIDGDIAMTTESFVGDFPVRLPLIDIHTVGAGGGSIAYVDAGGALRVGPRSAGADPGPVCYGKGTDLTVTDANLLLGRLDAQFFLGGRLPLDVERTTAIAAEFASRLRMTPRMLAEGIVRVANANMERAIRVVSVQRGFDPRDFALLAFGGAGGMHACEIAEALDIRTVIVPRLAGVLSAFGMLVADVRKDYSQSVLRACNSLGTGELEAMFAPLLARATADLASEGFSPRQVFVECSVDVRYVGQSYEITVPFTVDYREEFSRRHGRQYGYANELRATEIVNVRVMALGATAKPNVIRADPSGITAAVPYSERGAFFGGQTRRTGLYRYDELVAGAAADGPAIVTSAQATAVIPPGFCFQIDSLGNIIASRTVLAEGPNRVGVLAERRSA